MSRKKGESIILIGFMGAGKSTVGGIIRDKLGIRLLDTDQMIERREGRSITEIFNVDGETTFRNMETQLLEELNQMHLRDVISIGGGMPMRKVNRELLRSLGECVYLQARIETLVGRLQGDHTRPLLQTEDLQGRIETLLSAREQIYLQTADLVLKTDQLTPEETADEIIRLIRGASA